MPECHICAKSLSKKTLDKWGGKYCKTCYFDVLKEENNKLKCIQNFSNNDDLIKQAIDSKNLVNKLLNDNKNIKEILNNNNIFIENYNIDKRPDDCKCKKYNKNRILKYDGEIKNGLKNGYGKYYWEDGNKYEGEWKDNVLHGIGTYYWKSGAKYEGGLIKGEKNGKGIYYLKNGHKLYEGEWEKDIKHGNGKLYDNGNIEYEGEFIDGEREGYGKEYYSNGNIEYEGEFIDGEREGDGKEYYSNGIIKYEGNWCGGLMEGQCKLYDNGKLIFDGGVDFDYESDEYLRNGDGTEYHLGKEIRKGIWKDDVFLCSDDDACMICCTEKKCMVFIPCGHLCMCDNCSDKYTDDKCIVCRKEFSVPHKIYF